MKSAADEKNQGVCKRKSAAGDFLEGVFLLIKNTSFIRIPPYCGRSSNSLNSNALDNNYNRVTSASGANSRSSISLNSLAKCRPNKSIMKFIPQ